MFTAHYGQTMKTVSESGLIKLYILTRAEYIYRVKLTSQYVASSPLVRLCAVYTMSAYR